MQELKQVLREVDKEARAWRARDPHLMESAENAARRIREQIERGEVEE